MKVLVVFHGMPPMAGRTVVGSGLRAFANGETLRAAGHEVLYCTRHEDLPTELKSKARRAAPGGSLLLTSVTGPVASPGDRSRRRPPATAALDAVLGPAPAAIGMAPDEDPGLPLDWMAYRGSSWTPIVGLAPVGGPLGAPGNPLAYTEPHELQAAIGKVNPDAVLVESIEAARYIQEGRWTVILDLFAPRLLEQQFQTGPGDTREAVRILDAVQRADRFLFSNERQKYFHLPLLALAGVDCTREAGGVVPISGPPDTPPFVKPAELTFVAGGVFWPWADLSRGLGDLLSCLDRVDVGKVRLYGGEYGIRSDTEEYLDPRNALPKDHERVEFAGMVPIDTLWQQYRRGSVAFDLMAPNPEREINLSFRQIDYLRCGLPIITAPTQVIARDIEEYGAGWLVEPDDRESLERLVRKLATNPKLIAEAGTAAQALARDRYSWRTSGAALVHAVETPLHRTHGETVFANLARTQADLWEEHEDAKRLRIAAQRQHDELDKKSAEVTAQDAKIRQLLTTVDRLTLSLEEVSRFRTETVGYLAQEQDNSLREAAELQRELDRRDLDVKKKDKALVRVTAEVDKLKAAIAELETQNRVLQAKYATRDGDVLGLAERQRALQDRLRSRTSDLASAQREVATRDAALANLATQLRTQETESLVRNQRAEAAATKLLSASEGRLSEERSAHGHVRQEAAELASRVASLERDLRKKSEELALSKAQNSKALQSQIDRTQEELSRAEVQAEQMLRDVTERLAKVDGERSRLVVALREALASASDAEATLDREKDRIEAELRKKSEEAQRVRRQAEVAHERAMNQLRATHATDLENVTALNEASQESASQSRQREVAVLRTEQARNLAKKEAERQSAVDGLEARRLREVSGLEQAHSRALLAKDEEIARERERHESVLARELEKRDAVIADGERLRGSLETRFLTLLGNAEGEAQRSLSAAAARIQAVVQERGDLTASLEEAEFERGTLSAAVLKKDREVAAAVGRQNEFQGELDVLQRRVSELMLQVEQKDYAVRSLSADADKKSRELDGALEQRAELQRSLESSASTMSGLESQRDSAHEELASTLRKLARREAALAKTKAALRDLQFAEDEIAEEEPDRTPREPDTTPPAPDTTPPAPPPAEA